MRYTRFVFVFQGCSGEQEVKTLKLAHGLNTEHSVHIAMVKMANDLDSISGGKLKIEIYPSQQLGTERQMPRIITDRKLGYDQGFSGCFRKFLLRK